MLAPLRIPLLTSLYTLAGLFLAWLWYRGWYGVIAAVVLVAGALAVGLWPAARSAIATRPGRALRLFEAYAWVNGLLAAVAASVTVIVTIELARVPASDDSGKELMKQVSAAIVGLVGGLVVATKDADDELGKRIAKEFQGKFTMEGQEETGKVTLKKRSPSLLAVFTKYANGWTDWSVNNRRARVAALKDSLAKDRV